LPPEHAPPGRPPVEERIEKPVVAIAGEQRGHRDDHEEEQRCQCGAHFGKGDLPFALRRLGLVAEERCASRCRSQHSEPQPEDADEERRELAPHARREQLPGILEREATAGSRVIHAGSHAEGCELQARPQLRCAQPQEDPIERRDLRQLLAD